MKYNERVAIVTGGTGNLGRVIASHFAEHGIRVYIPVQSLEKFKEVFNETSGQSDVPFLRQCFGIPCDATDKADVDEFCRNIYNKENRIDYLINVIGGFHPKKYLTEMTDELINDQMKLNLFTAFYFTQSCVRYMLKRNFGRVVSFAAKAALEPVRGKFAYSLSKYAVLQLMNTFDLELKGNNITFNTVVPDIIDTPENRLSMPDRDHNKFVRPEDIVNICMFLIGDEATNVSGNVIKIYGNS